MGLDIKLLGPPAITVDGKPFRVDTRKATAVLGLVACSPGPVARASLAAMLWPEADSERSRAVLRRTLSALRSGLGDPDRLITSRHEVSIAHHDDVLIDVARFDALVAEADTSSLLEAAALHRGPFMAGFSLRDAPEFDDWMMATAAEYERAAARAFERLVIQLREEGRIDEAVEATARWLELDPLHEPAYRTLMELQAAGGDRAAAVKTFRRCVRTFRDELGVAPLPETADLYRRIIEGAPAVTTAVRGTPDVHQPLRPTFVGRADDLATARNAYAQSPERSQTLVLGGEAGIGKTRLIEELVTEVNDVSSITATAHPVGRPVAFGLVAAALGEAIRLPGAAAGLGEISTRWLAEAARLVPTITDLGVDLPEAPPLDGPGGHQRLIEGVARTLLASVEEPGIIVFEDLQWADDASVETISLLMNLPRPHLVVLSYRDGEIAAAHPLTETVREARRKGTATIVHLNRLSRDDVGVLIESGAGNNRVDADEVFAVTEGVPFFVVEYLAASTDGAVSGEIPQGVRDLIAGRLATVDELDRQLVDAAAVIGTSHDFVTLTAVSGRSDEETLHGIERLLTSGLIAEVTDGHFDLTHNQIQQFAYRDINGARRRLLHGRMADHLLAHGSDLTETALAAGHFEAAGRGDESAATHTLAAQAAAELYANREALEHYESALALGADESTGIRVAMADLAARLGDYPRALENLETAAAGAADGDMALVERKLAGIHAALGDWALAEAGYAASLEAADDDPLGRSRALTAWAWTAHRRGDPEHAVELARQGLEAATLSNDDLALAESHNVLGVIERPVDAGSARRHHEASLELVGSTSPAVRAGALNNLAVTHRMIGQPAAGIPFAREAIDICSMIGDRHREAAAHSNLADLLHRDGDSAAALEELKASAALFAEIGTGGETFRPEIWKLTEW